MDWLEFVGMAEFADVPAGALSYGQTKLVSLARVLATEAEVLLLDEPASGIDTKWVDTMLDLIEPCATRAARSASSSTTCTSSAGSPTTPTSWSSARSRPRARSPS